MCHTTGMEKEIMTNQLQTDVNDYIESCLDVNGSWRETFGDLAILHTLELDLDLEYSIIGSCIVDEMTEKGHDIEGRELEGLVNQYLSTFNHTVPTEWFESEDNLEYTRELIAELVVDEDYLETFFN